MAGFQSIDVHATYRQLIKSVSLLCLFMLTLALINSRERIRILAWTLLLSGTFQAVYGTLVAISEGSSASGTFINRNHLAGYLEMTLAVGIGLLIADLNRDDTTRWREKLRRWINTLLGPKARVRICLALMVTGLILTQSRMGNAAFFTALLLAGIAGLIIFRRSSRSVILLFSSLIIIDTLLMGAFFGIDKLQERIEQTDVSGDTRVYGNKLALEFLVNTFTITGDQESEEGTATPSDDTAKEATIAQRQATAADATEISEQESSGGKARQAGGGSTAKQTALIEKEPAGFSMPARTIVLGTGAGTYYTFFPLYRDQNVPLQNVHAHNDFFEFGLEFGIVGSILLITLVVVTFVTAIKAQTGRRSRLMQAMGFATMMAIFSLMIHSFTDFNLQIYANAATYIVILALPFIVSRRAQVS